MREHVRQRDMGANPWVVQREPGQVLRQLRVPAKPAAADLMGEDGGADGFGDRGQLKDGIGVDRNRGRRRGRCQSPPQRRSRRYRRRPPPFREHRSFAACPWRAGRAVGSRPESGPRARGAAGVSDGGNAVSGNAAFGSGRGAEGSRGEAPARPEAAWRRVREILFFINVRYRGEIEASPAPTPEAPDLKKFFLLLFVHKKKSFLPLRCGFAGVGDDREISHRLDEQFFRAVRAAAGIEQQRVAGGQVIGLVTVPVQHFAGPACR